ncbi:hypothetical protein CMI39_01670 [Candidatus Pacearchaeota archaeon]|nr:hypothetical protein [Candidatus Pacearchaeota archaeon]
MYIKVENKKGYLSGGHAINEMINILGDIWRQEALMPFYNNSLELINKNYSKARDSAIAFGKDVSKYPKRIRWQTAGLEIVEGVRSL